MGNDYDKYKLGYNAHGRMTAFNEKKLYVLEDKKINFDFLRKAAAHTLTISQRTIPVAGFVHDVDITKFWAEYESLKADKSRPIRISFNTMMLKLVSECLKAAPILNTHMTYKPFSATGVLEFKGKIDISMPVIFPNGRMLPLLVKDTGNKSLDESAFAVSEIVRKLDNTIIEESLFDMSIIRVGDIIKKGNLLRGLAMGLSGLIGPHKLKMPPEKDRRAYRKETDPNDILTADDIGEGTICVSDVGSIYSGRGFATTSPVLSPTTSCMAFCRVRDEQYVYKDEKGEIQIGTKKILPFTLLFDHKIGGFPDIVPFLKRMDEILENPEIVRSW